MLESRVKLAADGTLRLPPEILARLDWKTGSYIEVSVEDGTVRLRRLDVDPSRRPQRSLPPIPETLLEKERQSGGTP